MLATLLALTLQAGPVTPFPPPRLAAVTDRMKSDGGTVISSDLGKGELVLATPAGKVVYKAGPDVQVMGADGRPLGAIDKLAPGTKVRAYYVVDGGAKLLEVDVQGPMTTAAPSAPAAPAPDEGTPAIPAK